MNWLVDRIVAAILQWLLARGIRLGTQAQAEKEIDEKTKEAAEALKNAKSSEEYDDAARDVLSM